MSPPALLLRTDAGARWGAGHAMRCLALAQGWRDAGGAATFAFAAPPGATARRVEDEGFGCKVLDEEAGSEADADACAALAARLGASWVVVDGYHLGERYRHRLAAAGPRLLVVDDEGGGDYRDAHLVLNQNLHAEPSLYARRGAATELLLGPRYLLLRDELLARGDEPRVYPPRVRRLLLTFGGADPRQGTVRLLDALVAAAETGGFRDLEVVAVQGPHNPATDELRAARERAPFAVRLERDVDDMGRLMAECDLALTSGGTTVWEMAFLRLPALVVTTVPVEERLAEGLRREGLFAVLGDLDAVAEPELLRRSLAPWLDDAGRRRRAGEAGRRMVDGEGRRRVVAAMRHDEEG